MKKSLSARIAIILCLALVSFVAPCRGLASMDDSIRSFFDVKAGRSMNGGFSALNLGSETAPAYVVMKTVAKDIDRDGLDGAMDSGTALERQGQWISEGYGPCDTACGSGISAETFACVDEHGDASSNCGPVPDGKAMSCSVFSGCDTCRDVAEAGGPDGTYPLPGGPGYCATFSARGSGWELYRQFAIDPGTTRFGGLNIISGLPGFTAAGGKLSSGGYLYLSARSSSSPLEVVQWEGPSSNDTLTLPLPDGITDALVVFGGAFDGRTASCSFYAGGSVAGAMSANGATRAMLSANVEGKSSPYLSCSAFGTQVGEILYVFIKR